MNEQEDTPQTSISKAWTLEGIVAFWDTHSLDDYWGQTDEAVFTVRAQYRQYRSMNMVDLSQLKPQYVTNEAGKRPQLFYLLRNSKSFLKILRILPL